MGSWWSGPNAIERIRLAKAELTKNSGALERRIERLNEEVERNRKMVKEYRRTDNLGAAKVQAQEMLVNKDRVVALHQMKSRIATLIARLDQHGDEAAMQKAVLNMTKALTDINEAVSPKAMAEIMQK